MDNAESDWDSQFEIEEYESPKKRREHEEIRLNLTKLNFVKTSSLDQGQGQGPSTSKQNQTTKLGGVVQNQKDIFGKKRPLEPEEDVENYMISEFSSQSTELESQSEFKIEEFDSPKKNENQDDDEDDDKDKAKNTQQFSEQWTIVGGKKRKKLRLREQFQAIVTKYDASVRRFAHDYNLGKFDETSALTLVIKRIMGKEDKLVATICLKILENNEPDEDDELFVMFQPVYKFDIAVGVVIKVYKPWQEINVPGLPKPMLTCTDFYRVGEKRDNFFGVKIEFINKLKAEAGPFNPAMVPVVPVTDEVISRLRNLIPYRLRNSHTISRQTGTQRFKPSINLHVAIYKLSMNSLASNPTKSTTKYLLCDSNNYYSVLDLPDFKIMETQDQLCQVLESAQKFIRFKKLVITSRKTILEETTIFSIFRFMDSNQTFYYTLMLRPDTTWKIEFPFDIIHPVISSPKMFIYEFEDLDNSRDHRICLKCIIEEISCVNYHDVLQVADEMGDTLEIRVVMAEDVNSETFKQIQASGKQVEFDFLLVFKGKAILDEYSVILSQ